MTSEQAIEVREWAKAAIEAQRARELGISVGAFSRLAKHSEAYYDAMNRRTFLTRGRYDMEASIRSSVWEWVKLEARASKGNYGRHPDGWTALIDDILANHAMTVDAAS